MGLLLDTLTPSLLGIVTFVGSALLWVESLGPLTAVPVPLAESAWALDGVVFLEYLLLLPGFTPPPRSHVKWLSEILGQADGPYVERPEGGPLSPNHRMRELLVFLFLARCNGSRIARYDLPVVVVSLLAAYAWALAWQVHWLPLLSFISTATFVRSLAWWYIGGVGPLPTWHFRRWVGLTTSSNTEIALGVAGELSWGAASLVTWGAAFILKGILFGMTVFLYMYADFASGKSVRGWRQTGQHLRLLWHWWDQQGQEEQQRREEEQIAQAFLERQCREEKERAKQRQREREKEREAAAARRSLSPTKDTGGDSMLCVVCMMKPRTVGLKHNTGVHLCLCKQCQQTAKITVGSPCVICRQRVEEVMNIYT